MGPSKDSKVLEESADTDSNASVTNTESSVEINQDENDSSGSRLSLRAVLVPTEDSPLFGRETTRKHLKTYQSIMKSYTSEEVYQNSDVSSVEDGRRTMGYYIGLLFHWCRRTCIDLFKCYRNFAVKFRNSKFIYILQILLILLPISALWMGGKYSGSCPGSPQLVALTSTTGFVGLLLVGQWMIIKCCSSCEGQKCLILLFFVLVAGMLELEISHFTEKSFSFEPTAINYCNKAFYDYTYYKFIAAFGSMCLVVLLYFPDYRSYATDLGCNDPVTVFNSAAITGSWCEFTLERDYNRLQEL